MLRLTSKKDYTRLRESTQKVVGKYFVVVYLVDVSNANHLVGMTVSKKVGNAVIRNKVKRRIRAFLREYDIECRFGFMCNIIALPIVVGIDWILFKKDLVQCLDKMITKIELQVKNEI